MSAPCQCTSCAIARAEGVAPSAVEHVIYEPSGAPVFLSHSCGPAWAAALQIENAVVVRPFTSAQEDRVREIVREVLWLAAPDNGVAR